MKDSTTSIAKDEPTLSGSRSPQGVQLSHSGHTPIQVWKDRVVNALLALTMLAAGYQLAVRGQQWYGERVSSQQLDSTLVAVRAREKKFSRINEAFAGSLEDLKMPLSTSVRSRLSMAAAPFNGRPDFLAEYCQPGICRAIDSRGVIRASVEIEGAHKITEAPLKEGPGRYFKVQPQAIR